MRKSWSIEALHVAWNIANTKDTILVVHAEGRNERRPPTPVGENGQMQGSHTIGERLLDVVVQMCKALHAKRKLQWKLEELKNPVQNPMAVYFQVEDYVFNATSGTCVICLGSGSQTLGTVTRYFVDNVKINLIICKPLDFFGDRLPVLEFQRAMRIHAAWNKMEYFDLDRCVFDFLPLLPARKVAPSVHGPFQLPDHYSVREAVEHLCSQSLHSVVAASGEYFDYMDLIAVLAEESTLDAAKRKLRELHNAPATAIANYSRRSVAVTVSTGTPLRVILQLICGHSFLFKKSGETRPCRRVVIADDGVIVQIFGAAQILDICCCFARLTELLKRKTNLSKAAQWPDNYALESHEPVIKAISRMHRSGLTIVPVVEKKLLRGDIAMLGAISSSDLRHILHDIDRLNMSCGDFICMCSQQIRQNTSSFDKSRYPFISVKADAEVYDVAQKLLSARVHRVFLVNEKKIPVGIVSARDIVMLIYDEIVQLDQEQKRCHEFWKCVRHLSTTLGAWAHKACRPGPRAAIDARRGRSVLSRRSKPESTQVKWRDHHAHAPLVEEIDPTRYSDAEN